MALLAELKDHPSFVLLVSLFKELEQDVLTELAGEKSSAGLHRISRFYQNLRAVREFLETRPEAAAADLARIKQTYLDAGEGHLMDDEERFLRQDVVRQRFNPAPPQEGV
jgi:hypothetical protein